MLRGVLPRPIGMDKICLNAPPMLSAKCWTLKAKYMDVILNYVESTETPTQICAVSIT